MVEARQAEGSQKIFGRTLLDKSRPLIRPLEIRAAIVTAQHLAATAASRQFTIIIAEAVRRGMSPPLSYPSPFYTTALPIVAERLFSPDLWVQYSTWSDLANGPI